jgi:hypothetical protein
MVSDNSFLPPVKPIHRNQTEIEILFWDSTDWVGFNAQNTWYRPGYLGSNVEKKCDISCKFTTDKYPSNADCYITILKGKSWKCGCCFISSNCLH